MDRALRLAVVLSLFAVAPTAQAQDGMLPATFTSDRPGFANTSGVAAQGRLTTEMGVNATFDDVEQSGRLPNLSLRVGLFDWLEARVRGPNGLALFDATGDRFGIDDPVVGFKVGGQLHETLAISSVWEVSLPVGTDPFGAPEAEWRADVQADWRFWGPLTLTPNAVASVRSDVDPTTGETVRYFEGGGSLKLTWQIIDVLAVFVQSYALADEREEWDVWVGGALMWMVAPNVQIDAGADVRVTEDGVAPNRTIGTTTVSVGTTILW